MLVLTHGQDWQRVLIPTGACAGHVCAHISRVHTPGRSFCSCEVDTLIDEGSRVETMPATWAQTKKKLWLGQLGLHMSMSGEQGQAVINTAGGRAQVGVVQLSDDSWPAPISLLLLQGQQAVHVWWRA